MKQFQCSSLCIRTQHTIHQMNLVERSSQDGEETIENRIYREELKESLGMNFVSPFQPEREFQVYKSCKCSQIM